MLGVHKNYPFSLVATRTCHILILARLSFLQVIESNPSLKQMAPQMKQEELAAFEEFKSALKTQRRTRRFSNMNFATDVGEQALAGPRGSRPSIASLRGSMGRMSMVRCLKGSMGADPSNRLSIISPLPSANSNHTSPAESPRNSRPGSAQSFRGQSPAPICEDTPQLDGGEPISFMNLNIGERISLLKDRARDSTTSGRGTLLLLPGSRGTLTSLADPTSPPTVERASASSVVEFNLEPHLEASANADLFSDSASNDSAPSVCEQRSIPQVKTGTVGAMLTTKKVQEQGSMLESSGLSQWIPGGQPGLFVDDQSFRWKRAMALQEGLNKAALGLTSPRFADFPASPTSDADEKNMPSVYRRRKKALMCSVYSNDPRAFDKLQPIQRPQSVRSYIRSPLMSACDSPSSARVRVRSGAGMPW